MTLTLDACRDIPKNSASRVVDHELLRSLQKVMRAWLSPVMKSPFKEHGRETVMVELRLLTAFLAWAQMKQLGGKKKKKKQREVSTDF